MGVANILRCHLSPFTRLPKNIAVRVKEFHEYWLQRSRSVEEEAILSCLPLPMRTDLVLHLYKDIVEQVPFFRNKSSLFIGELVLKLRPILCAPVSACICMYGANTPMVEGFERFSLLLSA